jgi:hypothetical protein
VASVPPPGGSLRYRIAGLGIAVCSPGLPLLEESEPDYLPFLAPAGDPGPDEVRVELREGDAGAAAAGRTIFEAGESWVLRRQGDALTMTPLPASSDGRPPWSARIAERGRRVEITCSPELIGPGAAGPSLGSPFHYPLDQVVLMLALAGEGAVVHAAGVDLGRGGLVLAGASGAGKTTIARAAAAAGLAVLSDDRVIVRRDRAGWSVHGTPWPGEGRHAVNRGVPLRGLLFLSRGEEDHLAPLAPAAALRRLLPLTSLPLFDRELAGCALDCCADLVGAVPALELAFRPGPGAVRLLRERFA